MCLTSRCSVCFCDRDQEEALKKEEIEICEKEKMYKNNQLESNDQQQPTDSQGEQPSSSCSFSSSSQQAKAEPIQKDDAKTIRIFNSGDRVYYQKDNTVPPILGTVVKVVPGDCMDLSDVNYQVHLDSGFPDSSSSGKFDEIGYTVTP